MAYRVAAVTQGRARGHVTPSGTALDETGCNMKRYSASGASQTPLKVQSSSLRPFPATSHSHTQGQSTKGGVTRQARGSGGRALLSLASRGIAGSCVETPTRRGFISRGEGEGKQSITRAAAVHNTALSELVCMNTKAAACCVMFLRACCSSPCCSSPSYTKLGT
ncbi:hypothetical protein E2C01_041663 [Portunus trituberculatus]|uniref:Uncharacterized protein n=1 Tax=Portunus trituberculatus TaxID=210409 RepID=A0A5B7FN60_PORTR|nr:hypothetical protein [Portunus trituberculatus]